MKTIEFTKLRFIMIAVSILLLAAGLTVTILRGGFNLGVDFQAGLSVRVEIDAADAPTIEAVRDALSGVDSAQVQTVGAQDESQFTVRVRDSGETSDFSRVMSNQIIDELESEFGVGSISELENTYVGPRISGDLTRNTVLLTSLALVLILAYIWFRFHLDYAASAIVALAHDVSMMLVILGAFQIEVSTATIAAILTIIGYSLNDTIVIFDRVRENERVIRESAFETIINTSITQSLSRTLITSLTTLMAVAAIYIFATGTVQLFALNLIIGVIVGTYSSIFVASPVLLGWRTASRSRKAKKDAARHGSPLSGKAKSEDSEAPTSSGPDVSSAEKQKIMEEISRKRAASRGGSKPRKKR